MNIKSFITNIFSSSNKDRKGTQQDTPLTPTCPTNQTSDEYLLSNLRKSKLFLDDMMICSGKKETNPESYSNQAVSQVEKSVGLIPSASFESFASRKASKIQARQSLTDSAKKRLSAETITGFFERTSIIGDNAEVAGLRPRTTGGFFNQLDRLHEMEVSAINPRQISGENNSSKIHENISEKNIFQTGPQHQNYKKVGSSSMSSNLHELQGNQDIECEIGFQGENKPITLQPPQSPSCVEREGSFKVGQLTGSLKEQMECFSTKAEPPTQAKHRYNSIFFADASAEKQKSIDFGSIPRAASSKHSSASSKKAMSIESPSSSGSKQQVNVFNKELPYESRSAGSSPGRTSLHALHKQIDMMIDQNDQFKLKLTLDDINNDGFIERQPILESDELRSPKMRQKSVKFENPQKTLTPENTNSQNSQNDVEGNDFDGKCEKLDEIEHHKHHNLKVQSRIPTPYNPGKLVPRSHLLRQNKLNPEELQNVARPLFTKSQQNEDVEQTEFIPRENTDTLKESNKDKDNKSSSNPNQVLSRSKTVEKQNKVSANNIFTQKLDKLPKPPLNLKNNKQPKLPLAIKPKDVRTFTTKNQITNNNKTNPIGTTYLSIPFSSSNSSNSTSIPASTQVKPKIVSGKLINPTGDGSNRVLNPNNRKRQMTSEEESKSGFQRKTKISQEHSLSVPKNASITRNNFHGTQATPCDPKSVYKTCVFCIAEIKPKEKITTFACCHKAHNDCLQKEKNPVCAKCNVTKSNKLRSIKS